MKSQGVGRWRNRNRSKQLENAPQGILGCLLLFTWFCTSQLLLQPLLRITDADRVRWSHIPYSWSIGAMIPKVFPLSRVVLHCAKLARLKTESPRVPSPVWYWVRLVVQVYARYLESGDKVSLIILTRSVQGPRSSSLYSWSDGSHYWPRKAAKQAVHPDSAFPSSSPSFLVSCTRCICRSLGKATSFFSR